ncbi:hypothetical protein CsSME_00039176 [Camellia sinensis var. sinensis]
MAMIYDPLVHYQKNLHRIKNVNPDYYRQIGLLADESEGVLGNISSSTAVSIKVPTQGGGSTARRPAAGGFASGTSGGGTYTGGRAARGRSVGERAGGVSSTNRRVGRERSAFGSQASGSAPGRPTLDDFAPKVPTHASVSARGAHGEGTSTGPSE